MRAEIEPAQVWYTRIPTNPISALGIPPYTSPPGAVEDSSSFQRDVRRALV
jgi:hypothetical protein